MTPQELAALLGDQTPACGPAREALLAGGSWEPFSFLLPGSHHAGIVHTRHMAARRRGRSTLGFPETAEILARVGDSPVRNGWIRAADGRWYFHVFLDEAATTALACLRTGPWPALAVE